MKIKACASRRRSAPGSGTRPIRAKSSWHSAPDSPSSTRTVARDRPPSQRSATNRANVRYGTAVPSRASRSPILTVVSPPRTQARICSSRAHSASHAVPKPPGRPGRHDDTTAPTSPSSRASGADCWVNPAACAAST